MAFRLLLIFPGEDSSLAWYLAGVSYGQMNQGNTLQVSQILGDTDLKEAWILEAGASAARTFPSVISMGRGVMRTQGRGLL